MRPIVHDIRGSLSRPTRSSQKEESAMSLPSTFAIGGWHRDKREKKLLRR